MRPLRKADAISEKPMSALRPRGFAVRSPFRSSAGRFGESDWLYFFKGARCLGWLASRRVTLWTFLQVKESTLIVTAGSREKEAHDRC
jgi:hypothetical protein